MITEVSLHHTPEGQVIGLIFRTCNFVDDNLFLCLEIAFSKTGIHHIAEQFDSTLQVFAQDSGIVDGSLMRGKGIEFGANLIKLKRYFLPIQRLCALKDHMLQEMGDTCNTWVWFITGASTHIVRHSNRLKIGHWLCDDLQTIRKTVRMKHSAVVGCGFSHGAILQGAKVLFLYSMIALGSEDCQIVLPGNISPSRRLI